MPRILCAALVVAAVVTTAPAGVGAQGAPAGNALSYAIPGWVDYSATARPVDGFYASALRSECSTADRLDGLRGRADEVAYQTVGDRTGRIVGRVQTEDLGRSAGKYTKLLADRACAAYAADKVVSGTVSQYPTQPAAPTFAPTAVAVGDVTRLDFSGTGSTGPFAGAVLRAQAGDVVNTAAIRVANPQPGELDAIVTALAPTVRYGAEVAAVPAPSAKQFGALQEWTAGADPAFTEVVKTAFPDATASPAPRTTAPVYPAGCDDAFAAFVLAGQESALGGSTVTGGGGQAQIRLTPQVFATAKDAKRYAVLFDDLTACVRQVFGAGAGGQPVAVTRVPVSGQATKPDECAVNYVGTVGTPPVGSLVFGVYLVPGAPRAVTVNGRFAGSPAAQQVATGLCASLASAYGSR